MEPLPERLLPEEALELGTLVPGSRFTLTARARGGLLARADLEEAAKPAPLALVVLLVVSCHFGTKKFGQRNAGDREPKPGQDGVSYIPAG
jgi:hypothetical protein